MAAQGARMAAQGSRRGREERGATLIELALVLPVLALLAFAVAEVGLAWTAENRVQGAVSTVARTGASSGQIPSSDALMILSLRAALPAEDLQGLDRLVIYRANDAQGAPPAGCIFPVGDPSLAPAGSATCNTYTGDFVRSVTSADDARLSGGTGTVCSSSKRDRYYCPTTRKDTLSGPPDWIGVWVRVVHPNPLPFFFDDFTMEKRAVFRVQPDYTG